MANLHGFRKDSKITVLHIFSGDLWAGAEVMIFNLLRELNSFPGLKILALSLNEGVLTRKLRDSNIETHVIPESLHTFPGIFIKIFNLMKRKEIDIIHSHRYKENLLALFLSKFIGANGLVATLHGLSESPLDNKKGKNLRLKTKMDYLILRHYFTRVVAVSKEMSENLVQKFSFKPRKVEVIYNGIPTQSATPPVTQCMVNSLFHIGSVGRMVPVKDFNLFLEIAAELKKEVKNVRFSILGDGPLKEQLIQKANDLKIKDSVKFLSQRDDPFPYYKSLDLYLNTSFHEGLPLSILEAMSFGKPVVAPRVGGIPEIITHGKNGLLVEGRSYVTFAVSCLRLINDRNQRERFSEASIKTIEDNFSLTKMVEKYYTLYLNF